MPNDQPNTGDVTLSGAQKNLLTGFLDSEDSVKTIENWLITEWGVGPLKVKACTRVLFPVLRSIAGGFAERGIGRLHGYLSGKFPSYYRLAEALCGWLCYKVEDERVIETAIGAIPARVSDEQWRRFDNETKVWLKQIEELSLITATLEGFKAEIELEIDEPRPLQRDSPSQLLRPYNTFIGLIGRAEEMKTLQALCDSAEPLRWMVIAADGGAGKTRLALHFAEQQLRAGWNAGFLRTNPLRALVRHDHFPNWSPLVDTLIVVDYALGSREELKPLLERCARYARKFEASAPRIRLLLLERHGDEDSGWVNELKTFAEGRLRDDIAEGFAGVLELTAPRYDDSDEALRDVLIATFHAWKKLGGQPPPFPDLGAEDLQRLRRHTEGRPLYLQMAALRACMSGQAVALTHWRQEELLVDAVERERDLLGKRYADKPTREMIERAIALLTFLGPRPPTDDGWLQLLDHDAAACRYSPGQANDVSNAVAEALGLRDDGTIEPLGPDLLAEAHAVSVLSSRPTLAAQTLLNVAVAGGPEAWRILFRACSDLFLLPRFAIIEEWAYVVLVGASNDEIGALEPLLFEFEGVALGRRMAAKAYERLLAALPEGDEHQEERGRLHNNLGSHYSKQGDHDAALRVTEEAMEVYRKLAQKTPDRYLPDLAMSLNNLGNCYSEQGDHDAALRVTEEAMQIRRKLAEKSPDRYLPDLARSLGVLGRVKMHSEPQAAAAYFLEGIITLRRPFMLRPRAFVPLMGALVRDYLASCEAAGIEADEALLAPIVKVLQAVQQENKNG